MSNGQNWGFNSIGSVATKKPGGDQAVQLTFPDVYASVYSAHQPKPRYMPSVQRTPSTLWAGDDEQANWHEQKKRDADYMAGAKVQSTKSADVRYTSTPHGMGHLPPAVLGQRTFANMSNGAYSTSSARQDQPDAPFHFADAEGSLSGGVLRTSKGQAYGKKKLLDRIDQLNAIEEEKQKFLGLAPEVETGKVAPTQVVGQEALGEVTKFELFQGFKNILASMDVRARDGRTRISVEKTALAELTRLIALLFRFGPTASSGELGELKNYVDNTLQVLQLHQAPLNREGLILSSFDALINVYEKIDAYLDKMIEGMNLSPRDRLALSNAAVKTIGFAKLPSLAEYAGMGHNQMKQEGEFDHPAETREDTLANERPQGEFNEDERQAFGYQSGKFYRNGGRGDDEWFNKAAAVELPVTGSGLSSHFDKDLQGFGVSVLRKKKGSKK